MQDYRVELDAYSGPLDLLLYLVRRHEIDLHNIPIAKLTEQYLEHLRMIQQIDVELASEFLVMAATLLEIKSAMLLPPTASDSGNQNATDTEQQLDPRYALVRQLLAYKQFKDAATALERRRKDWEMRYPVQPADSAHEDPCAHQPDGTAQQIEIDLQDANVMDLCTAYARVIESVGPPRAALHEVVYDDTPIALHAEDIVDRLQREGAMSLQDIFVGRSTRSEKIGLFLATLELVRQRKIQLIQDQVDHQIHLALNRDGPTPTDPEADRSTRRDHGTGQPQRPSNEDQSERAQQRSQLRPMKKLDHTKPEASGPEPKR